MTHPRSRRPERTTRPTPAAACRCTPTTDMDGHTQTWPVVYAHHLGEAEYHIVRVHRSTCGLPAEHIDHSTWRTRR